MYYIYLFLVYFWEIEDHLICHEVEQGSDVKSKAKVFVRIYI